MGQHTVFQVRRGPPVELPVSGYDGVYDGGHILSVPSDGEAAAALQALRQTGLVDIPDMSFIGVRVRRPIPPGNLPAGITLENEGILGIEDPPRPPHPERSLAQQLEEAKVESQERRLLSLTTMMLELGLSEHEFRQWLRAQPPGLAEFADAQFPAPRFTIPKGSAMVLAIDGYADLIYGAADLERLLATER